MTCVDGGIEAGLAEVEICTCCAPVAFAFDGGDLTTLTLGVQVTVHSPPGGDSHGITTLLLQKLNRAEVLATERTLDRLLPLSFLMVCPNLHTFDVNAITTTKLAEGDRLVFP